MTEGRRKALLPAGQEQALPVELPQEAIPDGLLR